MDALATLGSAAILTWAGRYIDFMDLRKYSLLIVAGYTIAMLTLSFANGLIMAVIGLLGLRLTGQGLMGHTSVTSMARYFDRSRGKAISIATLGFPAGEAFLPLVVAFTMGAYGWRNTLQISAVLVVVVLTGLVLWFLRKVNTRPPLVKKAVKNEEKEVSQWSFLKKRNFWIIAPNVFLLGFINTALFFYQVSIGEFKGWSKEWVAASLAAFAAASALSMFTAGPLVDRFSARRLFPFYLLPYFLGLLLLSGFSAAWVYPATLLLLGFTNGMGSTIKNALQAELFGVTYLGSVRSLFTVLMVISTALGPLVYGLFIDAGISYNYVLLGSAVAILLALLQSFRVLRARASEV
ncbi:MAG: MFS transporter [Owenweeksia sp.]|nr:MFS transporter [Owenweeksia sp.]